MKCILEMNEFCILCLNVDVKLHKISIAQAIVIENMLKLKEFDNPWENQCLQKYHVCSICLALLFKISNFMKMILSAQKILSDLSKTRDTITKPMLKSIDRCINGLNPLSVVSFGIFDDDEKIYESQNIHENVSVEKKTENQVQECIKDCHKQKTDYNSTNEKKCIASSSSSDEDINEPVSFGIFDDDEKIYESQITHENVSVEKETENQVQECIKNCHKQKTDYNSTNENTCIALSSRSDEDKNEPLINIHLENEFIKTENDPLEAGDKVSKNNNTTNDSREIIKKQSKQKKRKNVHLDTKVPQQKIVTVDPDSPYFSETESSSSSEAERQHNKSDADYQPDSTSHSEDSDFDSYDDKEEKFKKPNDSYVGNELAQPNKPTRRRRKKAKDVDDRECPRKCDHITKPMLKSIDRCINGLNPLSVVSLGVFDNDEKLYESQNTHENVSVEKETENQVQECIKNCHKQKTDYNSTNENTCIALSSRSDEDINEPLINIHLENELIKTENDPLEAGDKVSKNNNTTNDSREIIKKQSKQKKRKNVHLDTKVPQQKIVTVDPDSPYFSETESSSSSEAERQHNKSDADYQPDSTSHSEDSDFDSYDDKEEKFKKPNDSYVGNELAQPNKRTRRRRKKAKDVDDRECPRKCDHITKPMLKSIDRCINGLNPLSVVSLGVFDNDEKLYESQNTHENVSVEKETENQVQECIKNCHKQKTDYNSTNENTCIALSSRSDEDINEPLINIHLENELIKTQNDPPEAGDKVSKNNNTTNDSREIIKKQSKQKKGKNLHLDTKVSQQKIVTVHPDNPYFPETKSSSSIKTERQQNINDADSQPDSTSHSEVLDVDKSEKTKKDSDVGNELAQPKKRRRRRRKKSKDIDDREYPRKCDHCDYIVMRKRVHYLHYLQEHLNVKYPYSNEKNYPCSICGILLMKHRLKAHERSHNAGYYKCPKCPKVYTTKLGRTRHQYNVHRNILYTCDYCSKSFKTRGVLQRHIRVHTGEKPYKCHICGAGFAHSGNRGIHIRSSHQNIKYVPKTQKQKNKKYDLTDAESESSCEQLIPKKRKRSIKKRKTTELGTKIEPASKKQSKERATHTKKKLQNKTDAHTITERGIGKQNKGKQSNKQKLSFGDKRQSQNRNCQSENFMESDDDSDDECLAEKKKRHELESNKVTLHEEKTAETDLKEGEKRSAHITQ